MIYAPVIIPTLCRYKHFKECLESLSKCKWAEETEVFVGLDYPAKESHRPGYEKIKSYLKEVGNMTFKKIHVFEREVNYGGGKNYSSIDFEEITTNNFSEEIDINFAKACLTGDGLLPSDNRAAPLLSRCIPMAAGTNNFRFITNGSYSSIPYLFNESPNINDLFSRR